MNNITRSSLIGVWRSYKQELGGIEAKEDRGTWIEMELTEDGHANVLISWDYVECHDRATRTRFWSLAQEENFPILDINGSIKLRIISCDNDILILRRKNQINYYFTRAANWNSIMAER